MTEGTITRQKDPEIGASTQMLAALVLLTKVLEVERRPMGKIEQMEARIEKLESLCLQKYPSRTEGHHVLNEPIPDATSGNSAASIETPKDQADKAGPSIIRKAKGSS